MLQAWFRGSLTRKKIAEHLNQLNGHQAYMSGAGSKLTRSLIVIINLDNILGEIYEGQFVNGDVQNLQLEEKGEVIFKNGAVYKGQWLGDMKHGYGV